MTRFDAYTITVALVLWYVMDFAGAFARGSVWVALPGLLLGPILGWLTGTVWGRRFWDR